VLPLRQSRRLRRGSSSPPVVFVVLDGDGFILQVHGVFTRIRSGATPVALDGGALRSTVAAACAGGDSGQDLFIS
jgi:NaMN:DMB phosphoribosyltransferase